MEGHAHLKIVAKSLALVGFWPLDIRNKFLSIAYDLYFKLLMTIYVIFVISEYVELYRILDTNLVNFCVLIGVNLLYTLGLAKLWVIRGATVQKLAKKIRTTEHGIINGRDASARTIYLRHVKQNHRVNFVFSVMGCICVIMFSITPKLTELVKPPERLFDIVDNETIVYRPRMLPLSSWFPYDRYKYYSFSYIWHLIALWIKILQGSLVNLRRIASETNREDSIADGLRRCIIYHKGIIQFIGELNSAMSTFLLFDFLSCGLQIAVLGFQMAVSDVSFELLNTIVYLGTMLMQLFLFYWYANEVLFESTEVLKAIWESNWSNFSEKNKKTLLIMMMRCQKPLTLSVGRIYIMSTETMMTILRVGYSYAAVMRRLYKK